LPYTITGLSGTVAGQPHYIDITDDYLCPTNCDVTIYQDVCDFCETAYGFYDEDNECFYDAGFSNWGWTNAFTPCLERTIPLYAGLPVCDPDVLTEASLTAHQVGEAVVYFDAMSHELWVTYNIFSPFVMNSSHVNVAIDPEKYPYKDDAMTVAPGQYTTKELGAISGEPNLIGTFGEYPDETKIWVIVHGVVCGPELPPLEYVETSSAKMITDAKVLLEPSDLKVYPNPFTEKVTFEFVSGKDAYGVLEIFNITGQKVARILDRPVEAGVMNRIEYEPNSKVTGMYFYRLDLGGELQVGRIIYKE